MNNLNHQTQYPVIYKMYNVNYIWGGYIAVLILFLIASVLLKAEHHAPSFIVIMITFSVSNLLNSTVELRDSDLSLGYGIKRKVIPLDKVKKVEVHPNSLFVETTDGEGARITKRLKDNVLNHLKNKFNDDSIFVEFS